MMKRKAMLSLFVIFLAAAIIGGATMAWFTAKAEAPPAEFVAGTVMVEADALFDLEEQFTNINPGDCYCASWEFVNTGSKAIRLRLIGEGDWDFDWQWLWDNKDELCYSEEPWNDIDAMKDDPRFEAGGMGHPNNPVIVVPCPYSGEVWYVVLLDSAGDIIDLSDPSNFQNVDKFHMYYSGVIPGVGDDNLEERTVKLCLCVFFNGERMTNLFQGATFSLSGQVQAIQASNNAPVLVWGEGWSVTTDEAFWALIADSNIIDPRLGEIDFSKCKDQDGNEAPCCVD